jgi:hypothetical protein
VGTLKDAFAARERQHHAFWSSDYLQVVDPGDFFDSQLSRFSQHVAKSHSIFA